MSYDELYKVRFDDLGKIITGKTPSTKVNQYWDGKIQFITPKDIQVNKYVNETDRYITEEGLKAINNILLHKGAVAVSCIGNIGYVGKIIHKAVTNQQLNAIIPNQYYDSDYVYYLMKNSWSLFKSLENQSTTVSIINKSQFSSLEVSVFKEKKKQESIVNILSSLDDKIELNNKINKNLEELAQTLYKQWFVDFEFPNENGNPYKSSGGKMIESELGLIPEGWEVKEVIDLFNFVGGSQPPKKEHIYENKEGYVRFIQNRDYSGNDNHITYIKESPRNKLCDETDIMMDKYGEAGKVRFGISGAYNVALAKIDSKDVDKEYLRRYFEQSSIENYILNASQASTRPSVNQTVFTNLKVAYPPTKLLNKFNEISRNIIIKTLLYRSENKKLAEMRDLLLPKLMSGEIRLPIEE